MGYRINLVSIQGFPGGSDSEESAFNAGDAHLIPGSGRSLGEGNSNSSILAWEISWTKETGGLQLMGSQRVAQNLAIKQPTVSI